MYTIYVDYICIYTEHIYIYIYIYMYLTVARVGQARARRKALLAAAACRDGGRVLGGVGALDGALHAGASPSLCLAFFIYIYIYIYIFIKSLNVLGAWVRSTARSMLVRLYVWLSLLPTNSFKHCQKLTLQHRNRPHVARCWFYPVDLGSAGEKWVK